MYHVGSPSCNEHLETIRDQVGHKRCEPLRRAPASPYCSGPWGMKTPVGDDAWMDIPYRQHPLPSSQLVTASALRAAISEPPRPSR